MVSAAYLLTTPSNVDLLGNIGMASPNKSTLGQRCRCGRAVCRHATHGLAIPRHRRAGSRSRHTASIAYRLRNGSSKRVHPPRAKADTLDPCRRWAWNSTVHNTGPIPRSEPGTSIDWPNSRPAAGRSFGSAPTCSDTDPTSLWHAPVVRYSPRVACYDPRVERRVVGPKQ